MFYVNAFFALKDLFLKNSLYAMSIVNMQKLSSLLILFFFITGCYQASLTPMMMVGPAAGVAQGRAVSSGISTGINYAVKHKTGKFPYQHIIKREKDRIVKKVDSVEKTFVTTSKDFKSKIEKSSQKIVSIKKNQTKKLFASANKIKKITKETFTNNKPRYSYWQK